MKLHYQNITLRKVRTEDKAPLYQLISTDLAWTCFNGPYFPYTTPTMTEFEAGLFKDLCEGDKALVIEVDGKTIGSVSFYWEDQRTRWLEAGIVIYDHHYWGKQIGRKALVPWISYLFETQTIARVGMTTWSGNPRMIACAESLGFKKEAVLRKVRFYQGEYYDSVKFGVLREEWFQRYPQENHESDR